MRHCQPSRSCVGRGGGGGGVKRCEEGPAREECGLAASGLPTIRMYVTKYLPKGTLPSQVGEVPLKVPRYLGRYLGTYLGSLSVGSRLCTDCPNGPNGAYTKTSAPNPGKKTHTPKCQKAVLADGAAYYPCLTLQSTKQKAKHRSATRRRSDTLRCGAYCVRQRDRRQLLEYGSTHPIACT